MMIDQLRWSLVPLQYPVSNSRNSAQFWQGLTRPRRIAFVPDRIYYLRHTSKIMHFPEPQERVSQCMWNQIKKQPITPLLLTIWQQRTHDFYYIELIDGTYIYFRSGSHKETIMARSGIIRRMDSWDSNAADPWAETFSNCEVKFCNHCLNNCALRGIPGETLIRTLERGLATSSTSGGVKYNLPREKVVVVTDHKLSPTHPATAITAYVDEKLPIY